MTGPGQVHFLRERHSGSGADPPPSWDEAAPVELSLRDIAAFEAGQG
jgi:hypothetical protein